VVVNISASPYRVGVQATRREMLATRSADNRAVLVYANQVGLQDGLIFDGGGFVFDCGRQLLNAPRFREGMWACEVDLDRTRRLRREDTTWRSDCTAFLRRGERVPTLRSQATTADRASLPYPPPPDGASYFLPAAQAVGDTPRNQLLDELADAIALGIGDYYRKAGRFDSIGIALSGGRDSLLTLLLAWLAARRAAEAPDGDAIPIRAFYMPSRFSLPATRNAARAICDELAVPLIEVPIEDAIDREADAVRAMQEGRDPDGITMQNIQARLRAARMWNWSNSAGALFLQTGDMSEKAVGYTTIGGDLEGALSPVANVPKTVVIALLERLHERFGFRGIRMTLDTDPGPELAADQTAENELMPFEVLDACLYLYAGEKLSGDELASVLPRLFPDVPADRLRTWAARFVTMFTRSIYKWVQAPLSLHVGTLDLERERALQIPVVHDSDWGTGNGS
jgi:NAD+ synthase (glutamine-hydrolysing)